MNNGLFEVIERLKAYPTAHDMKVMELKCYCATSALIAIAGTGLAMIAMAEATFTVEMVRIIAPAFPLMATFYLLAVILLVGCSVAARYLFSALSDVNFEEVRRLADVSKDARAIRDAVIALGRPMCGIDFSYMQDAARDELKYCQLVQGPTPAFPVDGGMAPPSDSWQGVESAPVDRMLLLAAEMDGPGDWRIKMGYFNEGAWVILGGSWTPTRWMEVPFGPAVSAGEPLAVGYDDLPRSRVKNAMVAYAAYTGRAARVMQERAAAVASAGAPRSIHSEIHRKIEEKH